MENRNARYPNRFRMTPVPGQPDVYDCERADNPTAPGTPLDMMHLFRDATAARMEFKDIKAAAPADALEYLYGLPLIHVWHRTSAGVDNGYTVGPVKRERFVLGVGAKIIDGPTWHIITPPLKVDADGNVTDLGTPQKITANSAPRLDLPHKIIMIDSPDATPGINMDSKIKKGVFYDLSGSTVDTIQHDDPNFSDKMGAFVDQYAVVTPHPKNNADYVYSTDPAKYSGPGFEYMGVFADKIGWVTGSYIGDGKFGSASKSTKIQFQRPPKMVMVTPDGGQQNWGNPRVWIKGIAKFGSYCSVGLSGTTLSWYSTEDARDQYNSSDMTYHYFALL